MQEHARRYDKWRKRLPSLQQARSNLRRNWYFPLSAVPFFLAETQGAEYAVGWLGLLLCALVLTLVAATSTDLWQATRTLPWYVQCWALLAAVGVCWHCYDIGTLLFPNNAWLAAQIPAPYFPRALAAGCAFAGFPFVYSGLSFVWQEMARLIRKFELLQFSRLEWVLYAAIALVLVVYAGWAFYSSTGFYSADNGGYDIIYTADTDTLFNNWAYLSLTYIENDLRQPLFAVFSAPFSGVPYFLSQLFQFSTPTTAVLLNTVQILMLFIGNLILASLAVQGAAKRICFVLVLSASYTTLLNALMLEQYVTAYFWLVLAVAAIVRRQCDEPLCAFGAMGSLLASGALIPWLSAHSPLHRPLQWLRDMLKLGLGFVVLLLGLARFDVLYSIIPKLDSLFKFTGGSVPFINRLQQYLSFIHDCFVQPVAHIAQGSAPEGILSWRLEFVPEWNLWGIALLALMILSVVLNRHARMTQIAAYWLVMSFVLLAVVGWGTWEYCLILYSLYLGWAYALLLFKLVETLAERLHARWLVPLACVMACSGMLALNVPAILAIVDYCTTYFPL